MKLLMLYFVAASPTTDTAAATDLTEGTVTASNKTHFQLLAI